MFPQSLCLNNVIQFEKVQEQEARERVLHQNALAVTPCEPAEQSKDRA